VSLAALKDKVEREYLNRSPHHLCCLLRRLIARVPLRVSSIQVSPEFQQVLKDVGAKMTAETQAGASPATTHQAAHDGEWCAAQLL